MPPVPAAAAAVTATDGPATIDAVTLLSCQNLHAYNNTSEHQHQHQHQDHRSQFHADHDDKMSLTAESAAAAAEKVRSWYSHQVSLKMPLSLPLSPSRPMVIPTKGHSRRWESKHRDHSHHHHHHKHAGVPPAVAALLAVTAIPPPGARRQRAQRRRAQQQQQQQAALDISIQPPTPSDDISLCFEEALSDSLGLGLGLSLRLGLDSVALSRDPSRCSTRSTLSALLLGAPDEYDEDEEEEEEEEEEEDDDDEEEEEEEGGGSTLLQKSPSDSHLSVRSGSGSDSSDSSDCVPSLEEDDDRSTFSWSSSTQSSSSSSSSPHSHRRSSASARMLASPSEECPFDHPLMLDPDADADADCLDSSSSDAPHPPPQQPHSPDSFAEDALKRVTRRLNFKSNLTASLRVLRSAARSFSSISVAAPFTQPDDYLTRSILSITPQFTDERRPAPSLDAPTPALRRYLNPSCTAHPDTPCTGAVQMQTYYTSHPATSTDTDDWNPPAPTTTPAPTAPRPREVRENGDFLRVIVLEMNMRRSGKLSDTAHGKAKLVLPPRQPCKQRRALGNGRGRWEAWVCNYDE